MTKETCGSAFPVMDCGHGSAYEDGMTLRQYAAIKLKVPDSGEDWLDVMITKSLRNDFAAKALTNSYAQHESDPHKAAQWSFSLADSMMKAGQE